MDDIHNIKEAPNKPNPEVIELLEDLLKKAKDGEIVTVAFAGVVKNNCSFNSFVGDYYPMSLIAELRVLERDVIDCCIDTRRKVCWEFTE